MAGFTIGKRFIDRTNLSPLTSGDGLEWSDADPALRDWHSNFVPAFAGLQILTESLILAQNER
ncbi:MAG: hypothetical protein ABR611_15605, partial [Chthoniobacterales bacterium]